MASDLKSDLVMTAFQSRSTVHLMGNPAVGIWVKVGLFFWYGESGIVGVT